MQPAILIFLAMVVLFLIVFIIIRTVTFSRRVEDIEPVAGCDLDVPLIAEHLARAIRCETISDLDSEKVNRQPFRAFHKIVEEMYPCVHSRLDRKMVNEFSLLYTWKGSRSELKPVLLMGHFDVVPADPATLTDWKHPPFSGKITKKYIWGRGTLDNKNQVIGTLEAVEKLLEEDYQPERTVYLAFGHDEEIGGHKGAQEIVKVLRKSGVRLSAVLDEGGMVVEGIVPGVASPVALIATVEKGYLTLELSTEGTPGHSSSPPRQTAIGILASALARIEATPMPSNTDYICQLYRWVGNSASLLYRLAFANLWLSGGIIKRLLSDSPKTNAIIRTTAAATVISGGIKDNILPSEAAAKVNLRLLPGDSMEKVIQRIEKVIDDKRVKVRKTDDGAWNASKNSSTDSKVFKNLERTVHQMFEGIVLAPYLMTGATDSRHYTQICDNVYRFTPIELEPADLSTVHGINERIAVDSLEKMVQFFIQIIRVWATEDESGS
jgi:carboxypeptidase PM20D1